MLSKIPPPLQGPPRSGRESICFRDDGQQGCLGAGPSPSSNAQALTPSLYSRSQRCEKASFRTRCFANHWNLVRFTSRGLASANCGDSRTPHRVVGHAVQPGLTCSKASLQKCPQTRLDTWPGSQGPFGI